MIHELRTYTCRQEDVSALVELMEKLMPVFEKNRIKIVGLWTHLIGRTEEFAYMLEYESLADREEKWDKFVQDPDLWKVAQDVGRYLTQAEHNVILQPTAYSPLR